jgi:hypothetical protein
MNPESIDTHISASSADQKIDILKNILLCKFDPTVTVALVSAIVQDE